MNRLLIFLIGLTPHLALAVPMEGHKMLISGPSIHAVNGAKEAMARGGNVVDVAVSAGLALAVSSPYFAALGGGGFALMKMGEGEVDVLDFREVAPAAMDSKYYVRLEKGASRLGGTAVGVPGYVAGLWAMHKKYGKLPWKSLFTYAINLAEKGMPVSGEWVRITQRASEDFSSGGLLHFTKSGKVYRPGETLVQKPLGAALRLIAEKGPDPFYKGKIGQDIISAIKNTNGHMTMTDLANYKVRWRKPLVTQFEGHDIYLMPPPSSGGIVILQALKLMEKINLKSYAPLSVNEFHLIGEIQNRAFRGRALLGDPDFHQNPFDHLTSKKYLSEMAKSISTEKVNELPPLKIPVAKTNEKKKEAAPTKKESTETTHFSVLDAQGNAVALTVTLNGGYGSKVVSEKYGIALNNEMDDFTTRPGEPNMFGLIQGEGNNVKAGKRPLSSMSPTLVGREGKIIMSLGAPGGPRIINGVLQTLYRVLVSGYNIDEAIQAPRVHNQYLPKILFYDDKRFVPETLAALEKKGRKTKASWIAKVYGVLKNFDGNLEAAYDSRGEGAAGGQ